MRLSPRDPGIGLALSGVAFAHLIGGNDEEGLRFSKLALQESPNHTPSLRAMIMALVRLGRIDEARVSARRMLDIDPGFTMAKLARYRDPVFMEGFRAALKTVGLPE
jgi:adenylate cyclase